MTTLHQPATRRAIVLIAALLMVVATACTSATTTPTATTAPTSTLPPVPTATATATPAPTATPTPTSTPTGPEFETEDCWMDTPDGLEIDCGWVAVPQDWSAEDGETYDVAVAVLRSTSDSPASDPLIYLAGGPGENALDTLTYVAEDLYGPFLADRDVVVFDQRGAGYSEPYAECPQLDELLIDQLDDTVNDAASIDAAGEKLIEASNACFDALEAEGIDLTTLSTANSARDAQAIMRSLGYDEWNLLGVSYGTRLAQTIMRDVPEGVRSVILDSVVPLEADLIAQTPGSFARALEVLFEACAEATACAEHHPDLEGDFLEAIATLNETPDMGTVINGLTGEQFDSVTTGVTLGDIVFNGLYSQEIIAILPEVIASASIGDATWVELLRGVNLLNAEFGSTGMQIALQCQEEVSFTNEELMAEGVEPYDVVRMLWEGTRTLGTEVLDVCAHWSLPGAPAIENEPVESDIPTLVMAGRFDPITPPSGSMDVAERLANATYVEFPNAGHAALTSGECAASIATSFLADPIAAVDTSCVAGLPGIPWIEPIAATEFEPFESSDAGVRGVRPVGWTETTPASFSRSALGVATVLQMMTPGFTGPTMVELIVANLPGDGTPLEVAPLEAGGETWRVFEVDVLGQVVLLAFTGSGSTVPFIVASGLATDAGAVHDNLLVPIAEALEAL